MIAAWRRLMFRYAARLRAWALAVIVLSLMAACSEREIWRNKEPVDQIPSFQQVSPQDLNSVLEAPGGAVVAVGANGTILRSTDKGEHWTKVGDGVTASNLQHVIATPDGTLVAVGDHGAIVRSHNSGAEWSLIPKSGTDKDLQRVLAVSRTVLVAVGDEGIIVRSKNAGDSWFPASRKSAPLLDVVATDSEHLLAVGKAGAILRSTGGGESWDLVPRQFRDLSQVLVTRTGALVAVGDSIQRANDIGSAWQPADVENTSASGAEMMPFTQVIEVADRHLVALGRGRKTQYSLDDGTTWKAAEADATLASADLALKARDGMLAALTDGQAMRSADGGVHWTPAYAPHAPRLRDAIVLADGALLAVGEAGAILKSTNNGANWTLMPGSGTADRLLDVAAGVNGVLVAVGERGAIMRSPDNGLSWTAIDTGREERLQHVLSQPAGPWIAVGQAGTILQSLTGDRPWTPAQVPDVNDELLDVISVSNPDAMVAIGGGGEVGRILYSEDGGQHWSIPQGSAPIKALRSITLHGNTLIAVGDGGTILRSTSPGTSWQPIPNSGTDKMLNSVTSLEKVLVACGSEGIIVRTTDPWVPWTPVEGWPAGNQPDECNVVAGSSGVLLAYGMRIGGDVGGAMMLRSTNGGANWAPVSSPALSVTALSNIVVQANGRMIGVGGRILRSIDDGASWSEVPGAKPRAGLSAGLTAPDGRLVVVGNQGLIMRETGRQSAPTVQRVTHRYTLDGFPVLRITLDDPAKLCPNAACLSALARSESAHKSGGDGMPQPRAALAGAQGTQADYELKIDPTLAKEQRTHPLYLSLAVDVPGHHRVVEATPGAELKVPNDPTPIWENPLVQFAAAVLAVLLACWIISAVWPLWWLRMMKVQEDLSKHDVKGWVGHIITVFVKLLLPILSRQPKVLDAWVKRHADRLAVAFDEAAKKVSDRSRYWALPVVGPDGARLLPSKSDTLAHYFKPKRVFMEIVGQGGAGKTRLVLHICEWLMRNELTIHPASAILIDEEFSDVFTVVSAKVTAALGDDAPVADFLKVLLSHGRLWVVIDRVSERQEQTRLAVSRVYQSVSPKVVLCTSRQPVELSGGRKITVTPEPLDRHTVRDFVWELLEENDARQLFPDPMPLVRIINDMAPYPEGQPDMPRVTPLLVTIIVAEAIESARAHGAAVLDRLPPSVPKMYFSYVLRLDETRQDQPAARGATPAALVTRAAAIIACVELGDDFRPKRVDNARVHQALMADRQIEASGIDFIDRFVQNGLLSRRTIGLESTVEYLLDPLAECLAANVHAYQCGASRECWEQLVQRVAALGAGAQGFMTALRMNHEAYANEFDFPPVTFPTAQ